MSFDMKYNRDGNPIKSQVVEQQIQAAQPVVEVPEPEVVQQPEPVEKPEVETEAEDVVVEQPTATATQAESAQAKNFRAVKDRAERAERERDEYFKMLKQIEAAKTKSEPEEDLNYNLEEDALVEGKHLSKVEKKIQKLERQLAQYEQRSTETTAESRLKSQFSDFDSVVTPENIQVLKDEYPELVQGLMATNDLYSKGKSAYTLLKKFGIAQDPITQSERATVLKNAAKPRPLASVSPQQGSTPLSQANAFANGLTKELREQLNREVQEARKRI